MDLNYLLSESENKYQILEDPIRWQLVKILLLLLLTLSAGTAVIEGITPMSALTPRMNHDPTEVVVKDKDVEDADVAAVAQDAVRELPLLKLMNV